ncbi:MAG: hypothetical protein ACI89X_003972 [Planctomycetota bacterium]|jgi:hypothetical protein
MRLLTVLFACSALGAQVLDAPVVTVPQKATDGLWLVAPNSGVSTLSATRWQ